LFHSNAVSASLCIKHAGFEQRETPS